jgi:acetyltransferase-like isoleucine patch superfamily enzyme
MRHLMSFDFMGINVTIAPSCDIRPGAAPCIHLGNDIVLSQDVWLNIPYEAPVPVKGSPIIKICDGAAIGRRCTISGINRIEIGEKSLFGPSVFITDHSHEFKSTILPIQDQGVTEGGTIIIEEGCWFGHNSAVITHRGREVIVGRNTIVGANAVITKSCPAYSVMVGNPARNVGMMSRGIHRP